ncbi:MAG: hypothetical protein FHP92_07775 [Denitromonas halophila]|nr:MAG: hypothetical protein FHP92_07775 [Denitromonas halophila]
MCTTKEPTAESLRLNKREMFDGMRAYHQSEISHASHAITLLLAIAGAAGAVVVAILFPKEPLAHLTAIAWGLFVVVSVFAFSVAITAHLKISSDHNTYAQYGQQYVLTSTLLGFYDSVSIDGVERPIKTNKALGEGTGFRKTQWIIWVVAAELIVLSLLFACYAPNFAAAAGAPALSATDVVCPKPVAQG